MTVIIDPSVRIIDEDNQVFVLHPGQNKRFMEDFAASSAVFLDLPGVKFDEPPSATSDVVQRKLRMSRRIRGWHSRGRPEDAAPSRDVASYKAGDKEKIRFLYEVEDLYSDAKAGDLVLVPGRGYGNTVLIGEFVGGFDRDFAVYPPRYRGEVIPARQVRWLHANVVKASFSQRLIKLMQNRQAIIRIRQPEDLHEVYERTYGDYVWGARSGNLVRVGAQEVDLRDLTKAADLTNYFAAQYLALKKGELEAFLRLPFDEALERYYDKAFFGGVAVEIHSPGFFGRVMKDAALAGYVSVMLALSSSAVPAQEASGAVVQNSVNDTVSICDVTLEKDVRETMEMHANFRLWDDVVCPKAGAASRDVGLTTDVEISTIEGNISSASDAYQVQALSGGQSRATEQ